MPPILRSFLTRYGVAPLAVAAALLLRLPFRLGPGSALPFLFLWPVVLFCAWYGGLGPGLLSTGLSVLAAFFLLAPARLPLAPRPTNLAGLATFAFVGCSICLMAEAMHRAREQANQQQEWLHVTLANIADGVITTDVEGRIIFLNAAAEALTGWQIAEAAGKPLETVFRIVNKQTRLPIPTPVQKVLATGTVVGQANPTLLISKDGRQTTLADSAAPIRDLSGAILGVVLVFRETGADRRAAAALSEEDHHKDRFLAVLGHELRNCLSPIRNTVQVIRHQAAERMSAEGQSWDILDRQVQHMSRLVDDLLDISRIAQGKLTLETRAVEFAPVVEQAVEMSRPLIQTRRHELTVHVPPGPVWLEADQTRLVQILTNLLNNAARYTDEGGRIALTAETNGREAVLRVRDSGMGIAPEVLPWVFLPFSQGDRAIGRTREGLGLGLALVKSLVEMHGGTVDVYSEGPGKGSEFVVRLPVRKGGPELESGKPQEEGTFASSPRRILVVDDHADAAESLTMLLRLQGHEVQTAGNGPAALEKAQMFHPQVVLMDIGLPDMDGREAARLLRAQFPKGTTLLIAVSGFGQEDHCRSHAAEFDAHLLKPVDLDVLQKLLAQPTPVET